MDTDLLRTFVAVARLGNMTAAARDLHLVQSTVTNRVQLLEKATGLQLFDRRPQGMMLTAEGETALAAAYDILDAVDRLLRLQHSEPVGAVTICAPESVCAYRLPDFIARISEVHANIEVTIEPAGTTATLSRLRERTADLGIIVDVMNPPRHLEASRIGHEEIVVVASPQFSGGGSSPRVEISTDHAEGSRCFLLEEGCFYSDRIASTLGPQSRITRFGSIEAARACAEAGLGLTVLPTVACASAIARGTLIEIAWQPDVPVSVLHSADRWQSPAAEAVRDELVNLYA